MYKETKIKTALHMHSSNDPTVKAAAKADLTRIKKGKVNNKKCKYLRQLDKRRDLNKSG